MSACVDSSPGSERGDVGLIWRGDALSETQTVSWITVQQKAQKGRPLLVRAVDFTRPVVLPSLPYGELQVNVVPKPVPVEAGKAKQARTTGLESSSLVRLDAKEVAHEVTLERIEGSVCAIECVGHDNAPLAGFVAKLADVTDEGVGLEVTVRSDNTGVIRFIGFPGRRYQLEMPRAKPFRWVYRSNVFEFDKKKGKRTWQIQLPNRLSIDVFVKADGELRCPDAAIPFALTCQKRTNYPHIGRQGHVLPKGSRFLQDGESVKICVVGKAADAYVVAQGATVTLAPGNQTHRVILLRKGIITVEAIGSGLHGGARMWLLNAAGDVVRAGHLRNVRVAPGQYRLFVWKRGCLVVRRRVTVEAARTEAITVTLTSSPVIKGVVVNADDEPVSGALVRCRYPQANMIRPPSCVTGTAGKFSLPVEDINDALVSVLTQKHGGRVQQIGAEDKIPNVLEPIRLADAVHVKGRLQVGKDIRKEVAPCTILWVHKDYPRIIGGMAQVQDGGAFQASLQCGAYKAYVMANGSGIRLKAFDCMVRKGTRRLELGAGHLNSVTWKKRHSLHDEGIR